MLIFTTQITTLFSRLCKNYYLPNAQIYGRVSFLCNVDCKLITKKQSGMRNVTKVCFVLNAEQWFLLSVSRRHNDLFLCYLQGLSWFLHIWVAIVIFNSQALRFYKAKIDLSANIYQSSYTDITVILNSIFHNFFAILQKINLYQLHRISC